MRLIGLMTALGACLLMMACGGTSGGGTASTPTPKPPATPQSVTFTETEFAIAPATVTLKSGSVKITVTNSGKFPHDLHIIDSKNVEAAATTAVLQPGQSGTFTANLPAGTYTTYCAVDGHRARGMQGSITVQ